MDATKRRPTPVMDADDEAQHGCANCGRDIPIGERRRLRMVEHDVEPDLCLTCRSDRTVKRQCGGVYTLRQEGLNRAQRRLIEQEREATQRHEATKLRRLERLLTQG